MNSEYHKHYMRMKSIGVRIFFGSMFLLISLMPSMIAQADTKTPSPDPNLLKGTAQSLHGGVAAFGTIVNTAITIAVSLAFLFFFWNLVSFIRASGEDQKTEAKTKMGWAILAIIVITSLWGIIAFVRSVLGIGVGTPNDVEIPGTQVGKIKKDGKELTNTNSGT